jgi:glycerol-3-phosphate acyltransferase PlsX
LAGATLVVKRVRGIRRAALAPQIPVFGGKAVLCDAGANAACTPEYLVQFAHLGNFYARRVMGLESPRVALLNIGAESEKGDDLRRETYAALEAASQAGQLRFVGNIEASDAMLGGADVIVADGFSGNIMLKSLEGTAKFLSKELKSMFLASGKTKLAGLLVKEQMAAFKKLLDPSEVGGTPFLGIAKPVIKAHGGSDARAMQNAVRQAEVFAKSGFLADVEALAAAMKEEKTEKI